MKTKPGHELGKDAPVGSVQPSAADPPAPPFREARRCSEQREGGSDKREINGGGEKG